MQGLPTGSPLGQVMQVSLDVGEELSFPSDSLSWLGQGMEVTRKAGTSGSLLARAFQRTPDRSWLTVEAVRPGARLGLAAPWGRTFLFLPSPPPLLVLPECLAACPPGAAGRIARRSRLPAPFTEPLSEEPLILMGRGGVCEVALGLGEEALFASALLAAIELEIAERIPKGKTPLPGQVRLVGPGLVWVQGAPETKITGRRPKDRGR